jgi:hypothetical protein
MRRAARFSSWSQTGRILGSAALTCGLLGACGGNTPSAPTTPAPTPTPAIPSPEPTNGGFLHVSHGSTVITYAIDGATGQLRESATQEFGHTAHFTGEPQSRLVFAAYGARYHQDASIVAYAPDPSSGSLATLSEVTGSDLYWLSASSTRVYGMTYGFTGAHYYPALVSYAVGSDGRLGPVSRWEFERDTLPSVAIDPDNDPDVFYNSTSTGGLTAHFVEPDGGLRQMGGSHLCVASSMLYPQPLVAARGFLFASADLPAAHTYGAPKETVCSWEGPRLAPRTNLGLPAHRAAAYIPRPDTTFSGRASATPMVAMTGDRWELQHEVRLFAMGGDGSLAPLDTAAGRWGVKDLLFHPSGRSLYASYVAYYEDSPIGLDVYSIDEQGRLELIQTLEDGGGTMAVTLAQGRASGSVQSQSNPPGE